MNEHATVAPDGVRIGNESLVAVTDSAVQKILQLQAREENKPFLRVRVTGGGCSGLAYKLKFVEGGKSGDILIRTGETQLLIDMKSALYLKGMTLDYSDRLVAGGFKFNNPNAKASCSCGESFAI